MDRKVWSDEEKLSVVLALLKGEQTAVEICRQYQISTTQAYRWRDLFLAGGKQALIIDAQKKILGH